MGLPGNPDEHLRHLEYGLGIHTRTHSFVIWETTMNKKHGFKMMLLQYPSIKFRRFSHIVIFTQNLLFP